MGKSKIREGGLVNGVSVWGRGNLGLVKGRIGLVEGRIGLVEGRIGLVKGPNRLC